MTDEMEIRLILADDHDIVRAGIKSILESTEDAIQVVGEAANGLEVMELAENRSADVYMLDVYMPGMDGLQTIENLIKMDPSSKIIILSMYADRILVERAFKAGARGYILKENAAEDVLRAVREVFGGGFFLSSKISRYFVESFLSEETETDREKDLLTGRQREILKLICDGSTEKEIARLLDISVYTVHTHKNNIMRTLDLHTKADLIRYAMKWGIIQQ